MIAAMTLAGAALWLVVLLLPWRPWSTRERFAAIPEGYPDLSDVTVLIPARDEAKFIAMTLNALRVQGRGLTVIVVDDGSSDGTADVARAEGATVITGAPLPAGWSGKVWALEQGRRHVKTPLLLLLDADIGLAPGTIPSLRKLMAAQAVQMASLMARLRMEDGWERLLLPAFVYFFKLLYPFIIANGPNRRIAAAAGGCVLLETRCLEAIGGFGAIKGALIDDVALARAMKRHGLRTWIGLTWAAWSFRPYGALCDIWRMVARSAYTQLGYSPLLLLLCTAVMLTAFAGPVVGFVAGPLPTTLAGAAGLAAMMASYVPTLRYYRLSPLWALAMPVIGLLYLAMTWTSALNHWRGRGNPWKGRGFPVRDTKSEA